MAELADAAADELEAIGALGALASAARDVAMQEQQLPASFPATVPNTHHQKWVQCSRCNKWRQVPYTVHDEHLPDEWECKDNIWDSQHSSCDAPQALSNEEIDAILAGQAAHADIPAAGIVAPTGLKENHEMEHHNQEHNYEGGEEGYDDAGDAVGDTDDVDEPMGVDMMADKARRAPQVLPMRRLEDGSDASYFSQGIRAIRGGRTAASMPVMQGPRGSPFRGTGRMSAVRSRPGLPTQAMALPPLPQQTVMMQPQPVRRGGRGNRGGRARGASTAGFGRPSAFTSSRDMNGIDEAAEALMGLNSGAMDMSHDPPMHTPYAGSEYQSGVEPAPPLQSHALGMNTASLAASAAIAKHYPYPRSTLTPGKVVWAKVEGHDWWPAKVVRRRAVPKEVGAPPGGQASVMMYIPVVFFTAGGIPGEADDATEGVTPGRRAMAVGTTGSERGRDSDEAEYAWLPLDCLKPFKTGEATGMEAVIANGDANLHASVQAAEAAVQAGAALGSAADESDSDGGWGIPTPKPPPPSTMRVRGRGRGKAGRRGRSRGGRRGRGRGRGNNYADDDYSEGEAAEQTPTAVTPAMDPNILNTKPIVEQILGWRQPAVATVAQAVADVQPPESLPNATNNNSTTPAVLAARDNEMSDVPTRTEEQTQPTDQQGVPSADANMQDGDTIMTSPIKQEPGTVDKTAEPSLNDAHAAPEAAAIPAAATVETSVPQIKVIGAETIVPAVQTVSSPTEATPLGLAPTALTDMHTHIIRPPTVTTAAGLPTTSSIVHTPTGDVVTGMPPVVNGFSVSTVVTNMGGVGVGTSKQGVPGASPMSGAALQGQTPADLTINNAQLPTEDPNAPEYLVKWVGRSHVHNEWVKEGLLMSIARRKLINFKKKHGDSPCNFQKPEWTIPERFVARRPSPVSPGWDVLVKWTTLGYEHATWEAEEQGLAAQPQYAHLHKQMWARQDAAIARASPACQQQAAATRAAAAQSLVDLPQQQATSEGVPSLYPHQLQVVNKLRHMWAHGQHTVLADEPGLGKTATVVAYLQSILWEFKAANPILIIVPQSQLEYWEGEWNFWAAHHALKPASSHAEAAGCNLMVYNGCSAARSILQDHELWLNPSSLDTKLKAVRQKYAPDGSHVPGRLPKPDVVLASYEAYVAEQNTMATIQWEVLLLDVRHRSRSVQLPKAHSALLDTMAHHRVLMMDSQLPGIIATDDLLAMLGFVYQLQGNQQAQPLLEVADVLGPAAGSMDEEETRIRLQALLQPHLTPCFGSSLYPQPPISHEVVVSLELTPQQANAYLIVLARYYEVLTDPKPPRHSGHRAAQLKQICSELRKICSHAWLLPEFEPEEGELTNPDQQTATTAAMTAAGDAVRSQPTPAEKEPSQVEPTVETDAMQVETVTAAALDSLQPPSGNTAMQVDQPDTQAVTDSVPEGNKDGAATDVQAAAPQQPANDTSNPEPELQTEPLSANETSEPKPELQSETAPVEVDTSVHKDKQAVDAEQQPVADTVAETADKSVVNEDQAEAPGAEPAQAAEPAPTDVEMTQAAEAAVEDKNSLPDGGLTQQEGPSPQTTAKARITACVAHSAKLQLLERLVEVLQGRRLLLVAQSTQVLELIAEWANEHLGQQTVMMLKPDLPSIQHYAAVNALQQPGCDVKLVLMTPTSFGLGTNLPTVDVVLLFDSEWHPMLDIQALRRAHRLGTGPQPIPLLRLTTMHTVEERLMQLADTSGAHQSLGVIFQAGSHTRSSLAGARLMESILRHGVEKLSAEQQKQGDATAPESQHVPLIPSPSQLTYILSAAEKHIPPVSTNTSTDTSDQVSCTTGALQQPQEAASSSGSNSIQMNAMVRVWSETLQQGSMSSAVSDATPEEPGSAVGASDVADMDAEGPGNEVAGNDEHDESRHGTTAGSSAQRNEAAAAQAKWWEAQLSARYAQLLKEDEEAAAAAGIAKLSSAGRNSQDRSGDVDMSMDRDQTGDDDGLGDSRDLHGPDDEVEGASEDDVVGDLQLARGSVKGSANAALGGAGDASGMYSWEDSRHAGKGRGKGRGKQAASGRGGRGFKGRKREQEDEAVYGSPHGNMQGMTYYQQQEAQNQHATPAGYGGTSSQANGTVERSVKRRRQIEEETAHAQAVRSGGGATPNAYGSMPTSNGTNNALMSPEAMRELLLREVSRMEAIKAAIADPSSAEHAVSARAYERLKGVIAELQLAPELLPGILDMSRQVADILLMMRGEDDVPADFQDYTLVAVAAVAAHLMKAGLGEDYGLVKLAERHGHDLASLDQVFWHILTRLSYYRELHVRSQQLHSEEGMANAGSMQSKQQQDAVTQQQAVVPASQPQQAAAPAQQQPVVVSEVDSFSSRLNNILTTDMTQALYAVVSQENIPLGPLATLMPLLQMANVLNTDPIKNALKVVRECQEQLVVLDRSHTWKVQQIQKEYQDFMERVRSRAQAAIDTANRDFQNSKTLLTNTMNTKVDYLQSQIPLQQLQHAASQIHRAAYAQVVQQQQHAAVSPSQQSTIPYQTTVAGNTAQVGTTVSNAGSQSQVTVYREAQQDANAGNTRGVTVVDGSNTVMVGIQNPEPSMVQQTIVANQPTANNVVVNTAQQPQQQQQVYVAVQGQHHQPTMTIGAAALNDLFRAVASGQLALEAIPEPIKSQIAVMFTPNAIRQMGFTSTEQLVAACMNAHQQQQQQANASIQSQQSVGGQQQQQQQQQLRNAAGMAGHAGISPANSTVAVAGNAAQQHPQHRAGPQPAQGPPGYPSTIAQNVAAIAHQQGQQRKPAMGPGMNAAPKQQQQTSTSPANAGNPAPPPAVVGVNLPIAAAAYQALMVQQQYHLQQQQRAAQAGQQQDVSGNAAAAAYASGTTPVPPPAISAPLMTRSSGNGPSPGISMHANAGSGSGVTVIGHAQRPPTLGGAVAWGPHSTATPTLRSVPSHTVTTGPGPTGAIVTMTQPGVTIVSMQQGTQPARLHSPTDMQTDQTLQPSQSQQGPVMISGDAPQATPSGLPTVAVPPSIHSMASIGSMGRPAVSVPNPGTTPPVAITTSALDNQKRSLSPSPPIVTTAIGPSIPLVAARASEPAQPPAEQSTVQQPHSQSAYMAQAIAAAQHLQQQLQQLQPQARSTSHSPTMPAPAAAVKPTAGNATSATAMIATTSSPPTQSPAVLLPQTGHAVMPEVPVPPPNQPEQGTPAMPVTSIPVPAAPTMNEQQAQQVPKDVETMQPMAVPSSVDTLPMAAPAAQPMDAQAGGQPAVASESAQKLEPAVEAQPPTDVLESAPVVSNPQPTPIEQVPEPASREDTAMDVETTGTQVPVNNTAIETNPATMDDDQDDELKAFQAAVSSIPFADEAGES